MSKKSKQQRLKEKRTRLYNQNPFCPKCKTKMILPEEIGFNVHPNNGKKTLKYNPDNLCTLEHKYSKMNPLRKTPCFNNEIRIIILCQKCNKNNADYDTERFWTIEDLRERSKRHKNN